MTAPSDAASAPNIRHRQRPMAKIQLPASQLAGLVPRESLLRSGGEEGLVELEADTVLAHIVPHISLAALAAARPDLFSPGPDFVRLPAWLLAGSYRVEEEKCDAENLFKSCSELLDSNIHSSIRNLETLFNPPVHEPPLPHAAELEIAEPIIDEPFAPEPLPQALPQTSPDQPQRLIELIQRLPTFHRFQPAEAETVFLEIEPCENGGDLADQLALQSLFLTDEDLTLRRVVELCGELPGIRSCVVTHGEMVVAAHKLPEGFDPVSMSATASRMLEAMSESADQLGIGEVPALTLHTSRGPLSVVRQGALSMLVVHDNRGFIPGVREKLTAALGEMARTPLALPRPASPDA